MKRLKRCSRCGKNLSYRNVSGLCGSCLSITRAKKFREKRKKEHLCLDCGKKIKPTIIYPEGLKSKKIVKYYVRCIKCREKNRSLGKNE